jgi:hypothetical protein
MDIYNCRVIDYATHGYLLEAATVFILHILADPASGVWICEADRRDAGGSDSWTPTVELLERLERAGHVKIFGRVDPGGTFAVAIDGYRISEGPQKGKRLNARKTSDYHAPVCDDADTKSGKKRHARRA